MRHRRGCWGWWRAGAALLVLAAGWMPVGHAADAAPGPETADARVERTVPQPLPGHPGNVFLAGEAVVVSGPCRVRRRRNHHGLSR
ncbi:MAG TPA: hypothetical protein PLF51_10900, partial [Candidatus Hydrogenedentes bacterium]|nr:hypothetical protein [Candidatus Hydrogenedentota bacterium]